MQLPLRILSILIEVALCGLSFFIVGMVTSEVVLRKFFETSLIVTEEMARYLMVWLVFLGGALAVRDGCHIRINFIVKRFGKTAQIAVATLAHLLTILFLALLIVEGVRILPQQFHQVTITFRAYMFYFYLAIPVGSALMIIFMIPRIREIFSGNMLEAPDLDEERMKEKC